MTYKKKGGEDKDEEEEAEDRDAGEEGEFDGDKGYSRY
jgi:hypothetical protein